MYGAIERIRIVRDKKGKSTGYAFIVFERERDMKGEVFRIPRALTTLLTWVYAVTLQLHTKTQKASRSSTKRFSSMSNVDAQSKDGNRGSWAVV
jgi:U1 small nuclear ribonucleoprotein